MDMKQDDSATACTRCGSNDHSLSYAKVSAAPEQEAVAWLLSVEGYKDVLVDNYQRALSEQEHFLGRGRTCVIRNLYTYADPSEVERLRADIATVKADRDAFGQNAVDMRAEVERLRAENKALHAAGEVVAGAIPRLDAARQQLAEAQAQHPIRALGHEAYSTLVGMVEYCLNKRVCLGMDEGYKDFLNEEGEHDFVKELRAFVQLSATAQPAECETCHGSRVVATTENDHEGNTIEARCPVCQGYGTVSTGIHESPSTICNKCDGTGKPADGVKP